MSDSTPAQTPKHSLGGNKEQIAMTVYSRVPEEKWSKLLDYHSAAMRAIWDKTGSGLSPEYQYHKRRFWWLAWIFHRLRRRKMMRLD